MNISFKEAFTYFFKEKYLLYKLGTFILLLYILFAFLYDIYWGRDNSPITIIFFLALCGYLAQLSNNLINNNKKILPDLINIRMDDPMAALQLNWAGLQISCILLCYLSPVYILWINVVKNKPYISDFHLGIVTVVLVFFIITSIIAITSFSDKLKFTDSFNIIKILKIFKYAYKEYLLLFLILFSFVSITYIPMQSVLRMQIVIMFLILNVLLDSVMLLLSRNKAVIEMIKRWTLLILIIFISVIYQHLAPLIFVNILGFAMLMIISAPVILGLQHLFYQAYMIGLNKIRESELSSRISSS
ncbi:MAG: hypothetical protein ACD_20C00085G0021 [uncultured bacterium]|nr:MAG: hypothetical protein ACD_20C00085G0021 [uncultured bacterium]HBH17540.1 hypothetical protein [Cyanobacteria bacterium UBA9579]